MEREYSRAAPGAAAPERLRETGQPTSIAATRQVASFYVERNSI
jgi:hypothetical protein